MNTEKHRKMVKETSPCKIYVYELWVDPRRDMIPCAYYFPSSHGTRMLDMYGWMEIRVKQAPPNISISLEITQDFLIRPESVWEDRTSGLVDANGDHHEVLTQFPGVFKDEFYCSAVRLHVVVLAPGRLEIRVGRSRFKREFDSCDKKMDECGF